MSLNREVVARVAEYMRQREIQEAGGNIDSTIHGVHTDPHAEPACLDSADLRALLAVRSDLRDRITQAVYDPGSVVGRRLGPSWGEGNPGYSPKPENLWDWVVRAVLHTVGHHDDSQTPTSKVTRPRRERRNGDTHEDPAA